MSSRAETPMDPQSTPPKQSMPPPSTPPNQLFPVPRGLSISNENETTPYASIKLPPMFVNKEHLSGNTDEDQPPPMMKSDKFGRTYSVIDYEMSLFHIQNAAEMEGGESVFGCQNMNTFDLSLNVSINYGALSPPSIVLNGRVTIGREHDTSKPLYRKISCTFPASQIKNLEWKVLNEHPSRLPPYLKDIWDICTDRKRHAMVSLYILQWNCDTAILEGFEDGLVELRFDKSHLGPKLEEVVHFMLVTRANGGTIQCVLPRESQSEMWERHALDAMKMRIENGNWPAVDPSLGAGNGNRTVKSGTSTNKNRSSADKSAAPTDLGSNGAADSTTDISSSESDKSDSDVDSAGAAVYEEVVPSIEKTAEPVSNDGMEVEHDGHKDKAFKPEDGGPVPLSGQMQADPFSPISEKNKESENSDLALFYEAAKKGEVDEELSEPDSTTSSRSRSLTATAIAAMNAGESPLIF